MDTEACNVVVREEIVEEAPRRPEFETTVETTTETTSSKGMCDNVMESSDKDEGTEFVSSETSRDGEVLVANYKFIVLGNLCQLRRLKRNHST